MPTRGSRTAVWLSLLAVLALLVIAAVTYNAITRSPRYSVAQLTRAVATKDMQDVRKYVDTEAVVSHGLDEATTRLFGKDDSLAGSLAARGAERLKPGLTDLTEDGMQTIIEMGPDRPDAAGGLAGLFAVRSVRSVVRLGDQALVIAEAPFGDERVVEIKFTMKRIDNYWRVIAVEDLVVHATAEDE